MDILFFFDMIIIFNTAIYDDDFYIITDRAKITNDYLSSWFVLDLFCILPLDYLIRGGGSTNFIRLVRLGRINKFLKLLKLMRLTRFSRKSSNSCLTMLTDYFKLSSAGKWFMSFFLYFCLTAHVISCLWLITAKFDPSEESWLEKLQGQKTNSELYLTSFYFTITTITTVGYGDWSATTFTEMVAATIIMFIGVIAFSFASGTLTNYIQQ